MYFTRLRLSGFKSFVDPTELRIEPGLTGVVGPNGCGKSNLLEALRWVMGENSAKNMRGGDMDDVIFAGTSNRPARNLAEVTLAIDNSERRAPSAFNDELDLEISRRIERNSGSAYRVNGRDVRARDVQLLFADAATGAHSPALVSQNRVGALINARPQDRRAILEEAAGISGLHSRRNEAERRLKAAESNLTRLHDVMQQIESQLASLRRQAAQARRYKKISGDIRRLQAVQLYQQWQRATALLHQGDARLREAEARVAEATSTVAQLSTEQIELSAHLPALRQAEAEAAAALHRLSVARESLAAEEQRLADIRRKLTGQLDHVGQDVAREQSIIADTDAALARVETERRNLAAETEGEAEAAEVAEAQLDEAGALTRGAEARLDELKTQAAAASAQRDRYAQEVEVADRRLARLRDEEAQIAIRLGSIAEAPELMARVAEAHEAIAQAEAVVEDAAMGQDQAEEAHRGAQAFEQSLRARLEETRTSLARLTAERDTLSRLLKSSAREDLTPLIDRLQVTAGYEVALGAALGDDLEAPVDEDSSIRWMTLPPYLTPQALPLGVNSLARFVKAPPALERRLSQTGVVGEDYAAKLAPSLLPGQRLVTPKGALWRWDGLVAAADAPSPAAVRLAQRNRLAELEVSCAGQEDELEGLNFQHDKAKSKVAAAAEAEQTARRTWRAAEERYAAAHKAHGEAERRAADVRAQIATLQARAAELTRDLEETLEQRELASLAMDSLSTDLSVEENLTQARHEVERLRQALSEARACHENLALQARHRVERHESLAREVEAWTLRRDSARRQIIALTDRAEGARHELAELEEKPALIADQRTALAEQISRAEEKRRQAADALAQAESSLGTKDAALRQAQAVLSEARENRVRLATGIEQLAERRKEVTIRIAEEFDCPPQRLLQAVEEEDPENLPPTEEIDSRLEKMKQERERMGPVNLRADVEVAAFEEQLATLQNECRDLETAISRLRQAIGSLNREGRERLLAAFEQVNTHFGTLFSTLFGGGHAHLALTESDDPLEAGLEIMASPPGKRLQILSLLSGGEQALTALSLIFAVFITNPAPICVLDEVDAPLDDANVERFCDLLDDMVVRTRTRFLIVTHNAVTMSRMNRLFGVTMVERGISQLVSVDLERAEALRAVS